MKKRIIYLLLISIFTLLILNKNVGCKAETIKEDKTNFIISEKGAMKLTDLMHEDIRQIQANGKTEEEGKYKICCYDYNDNKFYKDLVVSNYDKMKSGLNYYYHMYNIFFNIDDKAIIKSYNIYFINENDYYFYVNYDFISFSWTRIEYYENKILKNYNIFKNYTIKDCLIKDKNLICLINQKESEENKIALLELDQNIEIKNYYKYNSNRSEEGFKIYYFKEYLYLICVSNSNLIIFDREKANKVCLIIKCNPITFKKESVKMIGNNYDNNINKTFLIKNKIYIDMNLNGSTGDYFNTLDKSYSSRMVIEVDDSFNTKSIISISKSNKDYKLFLFEKYYYLISEESNYQRFIVIYSDFSNEKIYIINCNTDSIKNIVYLSLNDYIYIFISSNYLEEVVILNKEIYEKTEFTVYQKCIGVYNIDNEIYFMCLDDCLLIHKYYHINIEKYEKRINNYLVYENIHVYYNNQLIENYLKTDINNIEFGTYDMKIYSYTKYFSIIYKCRVKQTLRTNISSGQVYDIGLTLKFNGKALLNGKEINNYYIINEVGNYELVIYNDYEEKIKLNFVVKDICSQNQEFKEKENYDYGINKIGIEEEKPFDESKILIISNTSLENNNTITIIIIICTIIIGILSLIFIKRKKAAK